MKENHPHDDSHFYCRSQWWKKTCFTVNFLIIVTFILASSCYAGWCIGREYGNLHRHHHAIVRGWIVASSQSHPFSRQRKQESESLTTTQYSTVSVQAREQRKTNILLSSPSASLTKQTKGRVNSSCAHACIAAAPPILLHPALLAHRNPRQITIITAISTTTEQVDDSASLTIDRYIQEAVKHKAVENIKFFIVGNDSGERKLESPSMTGVTISFQWVTGEDFQEDADSSASREGGLRMGDEVDEHVQADEQPINVLFVDASITCQFSAHVVASWYERLLPKQGIVHHEHPMMMVELGWMASSPRTAAYRNALADRLDPANSATSSAVKMADFDGHWSEGSFVNRNLIVVFSTLSAQAFWHRSESEWNLVIHQQMKPYSKDQDHGLEYLDSTLMSLLEYPSKHSELEFCRRYPLLYDCRRGGSGFDPHKLNIKLEHLTVGKSRQGEHAGRGVFTLVDIPKKSYIGAENQEYARCRWKCNKLIQDMAYDLDNKSLKKRHLSIVMQFHGYGTSDQRWGRVDYEVDASMLLFVNHGCNGTYNINLSSDLHESNIEYPPMDLMSKASTPGTLSAEEKLLLLDQIPLEFKKETITFYFPIRNVVEDHASKSVEDIPAGEEILDNYMTYGGLQGRNFWLNAKSLWEECRGSAGVIEQYQKMTESEGVPKLPGNWDYGAPKPSSPPSSCEINPADQ